MRSLFRLPVRPFWVLAGFFFICSSPACTQKTPPTQSTLYSPRKDDLFLLKGVPFTLSAYNTLHAEFASLKPESILRLAVYAQEAQRISKRPLDLKKSFEVARALLLPIPQGSASASLTQEWLQNFDAASPKELEKKLRAPLVPGATLWNRPLLREIGISDPPWG